MAESIYELSARISLNTVGFTSGTALVMRGFEQIKNQVQMADRAVAGFEQRVLMQNMSTAQREAYRYTQALDAQTMAQTRLTEATKNYHRVIAGGVLTGVGIAGVGVMSGWVKSAATMQDALTQVGATAQGTQAQLTRLYNDSFTIAGQTQFSAPQVLDMAKVMAMHGFTDPSGKTSQRALIDQALPEFARAAEINYRMKGTPYADTVTALTQQAHMFGIYKGQALINNVDVATRAGLASGMTPDQQTNVLRYMMPAAKGLHLPTMDVYALTALANQNGLTMGRGGSNLGALFQYMVPGGSKAHQQGLNAVQTYGGGSFFDAKGQFEGIANAQKVLSTFMSARGLSDAQRLGALTAAFKQQGERAVVVLGTPNATKQYGNIVKQLQPYDPLKNPSGYATVAEMQRKLNQTLVGQMQTLSTNMSSISAMMGKELVPAAVHAANAFVMLTGGIIALGTHHPILVQLAADATVLMTAIGLVVGPILLVKGAWSLLGIPGMIKGLAEVADAFKWLSATEVIAGTAAKASAMAQGVAAVVTNSLSVSLIAAAVWNRALAVAQAAGAVVAGVAAGAYGVLDGAVIAMSGGFSIATIAAGALDLALSPIALTVAALAVGAGAAYYAWTNWATVIDALSGKLGPVGQVLATLVTTLDPAIGLIAVISGAFHNWDAIMAKVSATIRMLMADIKHLTHAIPSLPTLPGLPGLPAAGRTGVGAIERGFVQSLVPSLPIGPLMGALGVGGGGSIYDRLVMTPLPAAHATPVHTYHEDVVTHHRGERAGGPAHHAAATGAAPVYHLHIAPGAVGPIHVHGADHHDEESLAKRVGAHVVRDLGDELVHTLTSGAQSVFGLSPVLNTPAPR